MARDEDNKTNYYIYNGHADVVELTDDKGNVLNLYDYDEFGNPLVTLENTKNPYRYSGYYYDTDTGYYYLKARYYDPKTARFITEDTYTGTQDDPLSLNLYTYCEDDPIDNWDPDGHRLVILGDTTASRNKKKTKSNKTKQSNKKNEVYISKLKVDKNRPKIISQAINNVNKHMYSNKASAEIWELAQSYYKFKNKKETGKANFTLMLLNKDINEGGIGFDFVNKWLEDSGRDKDVEAMKLAASFVPVSVTEKRDIAEGAVEGLEDFTHILTTKAGKTEKITAKVASKLQLLKQGVSKATTKALTVYDPKFAVRQLLKDGNVTVDKLKSMLPKDVLNTFKPSATIKDGFKYDFTINGAKVEIKWHSEDLNAAEKYPGSNSGNGWSAQIKVGNKFLGRDGKLYKNNRQNITHIPVK